jgi:uncharacterized protein YbgA (DUF1722 family)
VLRRGAGLFAEAVLKKFSDVAVEDEGRLKNLRLREHFLTRIFTFARLRQVAESGAMRELVQFQATHKLLLLAYNQTEMRVLGRVVANRDQKGFAEVVKIYRTHLSKALARVPRFTSNINVLMHAFGYFSKRLSAAEKAYFLDSLEQFREGRVPLSSVISVLLSWIIRFDVQYLQSQTYFRPFPAQLVILKDSGKGRQGQ